jgi:hypothetical protein
VESKVRRRTSTTVPRRKAERTERVAHLKLLHGDTIALVLFEEMEPVVWECH